MNYDEQYRKSLENVDIAKLYEKAMKIDKVATLKLAKTDRKRIIRILEIYKETGKTKTELEIMSRQKGVPYEYIVFALNMPRDVLYNRIEKRVDKMIQEGLICEVENLLKKYNSFPTAMQGLGYKEVKAYLEGKCTKEEMIEKIKKDTRHYAKRQLTWFRKNKETIWLDAEEKMEYNIKKIIQTYDKKR